MKYTTNKTRRLIDLYTIGQTKWSNLLKINKDSSRFSIWFNVARTGTLGIDHDVGRKRFVIKDGPKKDQAGFHCPQCDENFLDSDSLLNHLNSRKHNRLLGMNLKVIFLSYW